MQTMIIVQPSLINSHTFVSIIHMLYIFSAYCPILAIKLLKMNITETLICLLIGSIEGKLPTKKSITYKSAALSTNETITNLTSIQQINNIELLPRTPQELYEIVSLIGEMLPRLPIDEPLFQVDQLFRIGKEYDTNANGYVLWHWQDDQGQLRPYSFQDSQTIEHSWQQHEEEVQLMISGRQYLLDLQQLQQINEETNQARFIKRIVTPTTPDISDPASPSSTLPNDESINSPSPQTTTITTVNNPIDHRQEILKDNSDLYNSFIQSLFTILYEVYNTSAGPAVKHRCLQSLLRMIYYSSSDLLETILKQQSISSHISSMLASSDYKIVISALQISEILMKKLPEIFSVYFYREGVVHQIEILIGFGITSSSNITIARTNHNPTTSQSQVDLVHINENSSIPTIPTLSESFDEQQIHSYSNDPPPTHRGAATQLHPKTQSFPYRGGTTSSSSSSSRRYQTETNPTKIETRSQRGRVPPPSSNSRIKSSTRSMFDEMTSSTNPPDTSSISFGSSRPRPTRGGGTTSGFFRPTTFDPSPYYPLPTGGSRPRPSTPIYVPSSYLQQTPYAYASSAPAAASLMMSTSMSTSVIRQQQSQVQLSSQDKSKLKEWIQNQAENFRTTYFSNNTLTSNIALQIINRLASAVDILHVGKDHTENAKALRDIANIIAKGDVTPFEMVHSGLITKLFQYLTDDISIPNDRLERLKLFLNIFINLPYENKEEDEKTLKQFIIELHHIQLNHGKSNLNILNHLINKLHGCINQLEQFPIRVNDIAGRSTHNSALRLISTHQLKCNLIRHPQCKTLKQWNSGPMKIDPFALVSAIEKYLLLRGVATNSLVNHFIIYIYIYIFFVKRLIHLVQLKMKKVKYQMNLMRKMLLMFLHIQQQ
jgi:E3 ubiquitin-protein ligase TRIP12